MKNKKIVSRIGNETKTATNRKKPTTIVTASACGRVTFNDVMVSKNNKQNRSVANNERITPVEAHSTNSIFIGSL